MEAPTSPPKPHSALRSAVRVKAAAVVLLFLICALLLKITSSEKYQDIIFLVAAAICVAPYFIRCETCHSSIYYGAGGERHFFAGQRFNTFLFAARCPYCGMERR